MRCPKIREASLFLAVALTAAGCGIYGRSDRAKLTISFERARPSGDKFLTAPNLITDFQCLVVNVMGSGVSANEDPALMLKKHDALKAGGFCSYAGVLSSPVIIGQETDVTLAVPRGSQRWVQLLGVKDPNGKVCSGNGSPTETSLMATADVWVYEVARTVIDLTYDQEVTLQSAYNVLSSTDKDEHLVQCTQELAKWTTRTTSGGGAVATALTAGTFQSCGIFNGGAKCWGQNGQGQIGDGTTTNRLTPVDVSGLTSGVIDISAGAFHTCAVTSAGAAMCWGQNDKGQVGDGTVTNRSSPTQVSGLTSGVLAITTGAYHSCALLSASIVCWGYNSNGQIGNGNTTDQHTPVAVSGVGAGVSAVSAGANHTCAIVSGAAQCWGTNGTGQLGDNTVIQRLTPVGVSGLGSGVSSISGGQVHTCALLATGGAKCWGGNSSGLLGDGTTTDRHVPTDVSGMTSGVSTLATGDIASCSTVSGAAYCWGDNFSGAVGDGTTTQRSSPTAVSGLSSGVAFLAGGNSYTCAAMSSGGVKCWGSNTYGQLGNNTTTDEHAPVDVMGL